MSMPEPLTPRYSQPQVLFVGGRNDGAGGQGRSGKPDVDSASRYSTDVERARSSMCGVFRSNAARIWLEEFKRYFLSQ
jgi:hypothetical protein